MEFNGMTQNERNLNVSYANTFASTATQGYRSSDSKVKVNRRNDRVNPLVYLIKKKEEFNNEHLEQTLAQTNIL